MTTQTYANRSNAARAARAACVAAGVSAPLSQVHFQVTEASEKPGEFTYILIDTATGETSRSFGDDPGAAFEAPASELQGQEGRPSNETPPVVEQIDVAKLPAPPAPPKKGGKSKPAAKADAGDKAPKKSTLLIEQAKSAKGITNEEIKALTGWTKLGGFFDAVKRAGLVMVRRREQADTRWFAVTTTEGPGVHHVFVRREIGGAWSKVGMAADQAEALKLAGGDDMAVETSDRDGEGACLFVAPRAALGK